MLRQFLGNSYLFGGNAPFIEELYEQYLANPGSVAHEWREYFDSLQVLPGAADGKDVAHAPVVQSFVERAKAGELGAQPQAAAAADDRLALALEKIALEDPYFVDRKLYPNVDFYSGIVQRALGIPVSMFTCIFSLARTVGWIAQWQEMISDPEYKIGRPRQLYRGAARREVKPIGQR